MRSCHRTCSCAPGVRLATSIPATAGISSGNTTRIDHSLLNGHACARFQLTTGVGGSTFNGHQTGIYDTGGYFYVFNQDLTTIPAGTQFHVVLDAQQIHECSDLIFAYGFEWKTGVRAGMHSFTGYLPNRAANRGTRLVSRSGMLAASPVQWPTDSDR